MMNQYHLINRGKEYFGTITADKPPSVPYTTVAPPQSIIDGLASLDAPTEVAEWNDVSWSIKTRAMMSEYRHKDSYRTLVTPDELIDLFTGTEWGQMRNTSDPDAAQFVDQLKSRWKTVDLTDRRTRSGLTKLVKASDINFNKQRAAVIIKGIKV